MSSDVRPIGWERVGVIFLICHLELWWEKHCNRYFSSSKRFSPIVRIHLNCIIIFIHYFYSLFNFPFGLETVIMIMFGIPITLSSFPSGIHSFAALLSSKIKPGACSHSYSITTKIPLNGV